MNLRKKLTIFYFLVSIIPLVTLAGIFYAYSQRIIIEKEFVSLQQISDVKISRINEFYTTLSNEARITQKYYNIRSNFPVLLKYRNSPQALEYIDAKSKLDEQLSAWFGTRNDTEDIMLVDQNGIIFYAANPFNQRYLNKKLNTTGRDLFSSELKGVSISDLFLEDNSSNRYFLQAQVSVTDLSNKEKVFVVLKIRANELYQLIQDTTGLGQTGETLIGKVYNDLEQNKKYVLYLNPLRHDPDAAFRRKIFLGESNGIPIQNAAMERNGSGTEIDYRGKPTISVWRYLPERKWAFVAKIDKSEALEKVNRLTFFSILLSVSLSLILAAIIVLLSKRITDPIKNLAMVADQLSRADFTTTTTTVDINSNDEIGMLARSFNTMSAKLKEYYGELERKIKERTEALDEKVKNLEDSRKASMNLLEDLERVKNLLEQEQVKDEAILASIGDGLVATDINTRVILMNEACERLVGWKKEEVIGKSWFEVVPMEDEKGNTIPNDKRPIMQAISHRKSTTTTYYFVRRDKTIFPVAITATPIILNGEVVGAIGVYRDITEEVEADKVKSEFLSIASHELRAPLGIIKAFISMIFDGDYGEVSPKLQAPLQDISSSTERIIHLVNDMLNVSRMEAGRMLFKLSEFTVEALIREVAVGFAKTVKEGVTIEVKNIDNVAIQADQDGVLVQADQDKVREILNNLISNAIKFTDKGIITIYTKKEGEFVWVFVEDTGIGIAPEDQQKIFGKFHQATSVERGKPQGTGLGLYICQLLGQKMGGKVWLESSIPGKGSTFAFSLPITGTDSAMKIKKTLEEEARVLPDQKPNI